MDDLLACWHDGVGHGRVEEGKVLVLHHLTHLVPFEVGHVTERSSSRKSAWVMCAVVPLACAQLKFDTQVWEQLLVEHVVVGFWLPQTVV